jgi:hypothetical protein
VRSPRPVRAILRIENLTLTSVLNVSRAAGTLQLHVFTDAASARTAVKHFTRFYVSACVACVHDIYCQL